MMNRKPCIIILHWDLQILQHLWPQHPSKAQLGWKAHEHWYFGDRVACQGTLSWVQKEVNTNPGPKSKSLWPREKKYLNRRELDRINGVEIQRSLPNAPNDKGEGFEDLWMTCLGCKVKALMAAMSPQVRAEWKQGQHLMLAWRLAQV